MTGPWDTVRLDSACDGVRVVTMHRPEARNALTDQLVTELAEAFEAVSRDESCHVIVLTGAGQAFCAGLDLNDYGDAGQVIEQGELRRTLTRQVEIAGLVTRMRRLRQPIVAAVNGAAAGGGLALVLASDIRLASREAVFAVSFIRAGYSGCDIGTSWLLPRIVGAGRAHELMLTGRRFDASEAERIGLVTKVVEPARLEEEALATVALLQRNPPLSLELTKQGMWTALEMPAFASAVEYENRQQVITALTADRVEATRAFLEKRDPVYRYR
ncbi:MAG: enoyl-CoA hydratase/isomerase family protein [Trebonia sp.]|jgi:enoyl-CoA hydratase